MDELNSLLRAVIADPDADLPRLMYADALEGLDSTYIRCPTCTGVPGRILRGGRGNGDVYHPVVELECPRCRGVGQIPDTTNADRAAFIRAQIEATQFPCTRPHYENVRRDLHGSGRVVERDPREHCGWCENCQLREVWEGTAEALFRKMNPLGADRLASDVRAELADYARGFRFRWRGTLDQLHKVADALLWRAEWGCLSCRSRGRRRRTDDPRVFNDEYTEPCPVCAGSRVRPCPPTAQPIRTVVIPRMSWVPDSSGFGEMRLSTPAWFAERFPGLEIQTTPVPIAVELDENPDPADPVPAPE